MIKRTVEKIIIEDSHTFPVVLLTGMRQVGKSTILDYLLKKKLINASCHINLKDLILKMLAKSDPASFLSSYDFPLIINEIQEAPELFSQIKVIVDKQRINNEKNSYGMFFLTGSSKLNIMKLVKESLVGI
ncbi:MAG: AAA family ATPase [Mycoplasmataceae bacterium]|jgi:predicted AAA+ superfamily ATPase|nr:AAA family ATPase [Mycoplasmataceae bacterium]